MTDQPLPEVCQDAAMTPETERALADAARRYADATRDLATIIESRVKPARRALVAAIRRAIAEGETQLAIARRLGVDKSRVTHMLQKERDSE